MTVTLGKGYNLNANPRCLSRNLIILPANDTSVGPEMVDDILKEKEYYAMSLVMTNTPKFSNSNPQRYGLHSIGHIGPGGDVRICFFSMIVIIIIIIFPFTPTLPERWVSCTFTYKSI